MVKNVFKILVMLFLTTLQSQAFEDCIIVSDEPLVDIKIENNKIIDVCPLITVMNEKNILIVHPLSEGVTCFTVWKGYKEKLFFNVKVSETQTFIPEVDGVSIFTMDEPPEGDSSFLDLPPGLNVPSEIGGGK